MSKQNKQQNGFDKFLNIIEKVGNKVPHPIMIFIILAVGVILLSHLFYLLGTNVTYQSIDLQTMQPVMLDVYVESLLTVEGIRFIFTSAVSNYAAMPAKALILVAMMGVGVAEGSGLIGTIIRKVLLGASPKLVTFLLVFIGAISSVAVDAGYLVVIPLGAAIFHSMGRHPIAGLAAAFAGVSGGFGANILITPIDGLIVSITNEAIALIDPTYTIDIMSNYYFAFVSTFLVAIIGTIVTIVLIEPRLGQYTGNVVADRSEEISPEENRGLKFALISFILFTIFILAITLPIGSPLRNPETNTIMRDSPFMDALVFIIALSFFIPGVAYGYGSKSINGVRDIIKLTEKAMASLAGLLVILFVVAQFVAYFNYSRLGTVLAVNGAIFLETIGLTGLGLILAFTILCLLLNFLIGGMTTKWLILAPIFIPMFMQMGISPAMTQAAYRIGDSASNMMNPLMSYFALIIVFTQKYDEEAGMGTVIATMLPYAVWFTIGWLLLISVWYIIGLPLGPGAGIHMPGF